MREKHVILAVGALIALSIACILALWATPPAGARPQLARETLTPDPSLPPGTWPTPTPIPTPRPWPTVDPYPAPGGARGVFANGETAEPQLQATWGPGFVRLAWAGAPAGACLYRLPAIGGRILLGDVPCGPAGRVQVGPGGDTAYMPRAGDRFVLRDEQGQRDLVEVGPLGRYILPLVVRP